MVEFKNFDYFDGRCKNTHIFAKKIRGQLISSCTIDGLIVEKS